MNRDDPIAFWERLMGGAGPIRNFFWEGWRSASSKLDTTGTESFELKMKGFMKKKEKTGYPFDL